MARKIRLTKSMIEKIFEDAPDTAKATEALYRVAFPDWDDIARIEGYPKVSRETNTVIFRHMMDLDRANEVTHMHGGAWFNSGFSQDDVPDWVIDLSRCKAIKE
jgi:hypothetical protein